MRTQHDGIKESGKAFVGIKVHRMQKRIAVIGSGVSGLVCARLLATQHDVTLIEAADRLGGHAHTVEAEVEGRDVAADVGFMVFNRRTYPNFCRLLEILGIDSQPSDMSFSVRADHAGVEYQSNCLFANWGSAFRPQFLRMLWDVTRFNREARAYLDDVGRDVAAARSATASRLTPDGDGASTSTLTLGEFIRRGRFGSRLLPDYLLPMMAAIWSAPPRDVEAFPAAFLFQFLGNHGLLQLSDRPQWLTIPGGSRRYVAALAGPLAGRIRLRRPVHTVQRTAEGVSVQAGRETAEHFDAVVLATHAPQSLAMLVDANAAEREVLGAFAYQSNSAFLHTDVRFMPRRRRAWASWNFLAVADPTSPAAVTYDLTRLQRLGLEAPLCVTLNPPTAVKPADIVQSLRFEHPLFSAATVAAQARRGELHRDGRVYFCGSYWGYGFHEDGVNSALAVAKCFALALDDLAHDVRHLSSPCTVASMPAASPMYAASR